MRHSRRQMHQREESERDKNLQMQKGKQERNSLNEESKIADRQVGVRKKKIKKEMHRFWP